MEFSGALFSSSWIGVSSLAYAGVLGLAVRRARWGRLGDAAQLNVFLGSIVCLMLLWSMRVDVQPGLSWHLSALVTVTLMFSWSLAIVAGSLALIGTTLSGLGDWSGFALSALIFIVLPVSLAQFFLGLARAYLPKHYFTYVFVNAFFAGGLIALLVALAATGMLLAANAFTLEKLVDNYLLFLPLMFFPEAVLNGWMTTILVGFKPHWLGSFRDEEYLHGK